MEKFPKRLSSKNNTEIWVHKINKKLRVIKTL